MLLSRGTPLQQTRRSRLQQKRCCLNEQIKKELRLKAGALNLLSATTDRKIRQQIQLELSYVESNIELLKDQFSALNTSVDVYQSERSAGFLPLIPLGLKETKPISFAVPFKDFILEHYSENPSFYDEAVEQFESLRSSAQRPVRDQEGLNILSGYLVQLGYVEKRFFTHNQPLNIYFEWYDALTGVPCMQKSLAFEKGAIIFNLAALLTQIAAKQDRADLNGLEAAVDSLCGASGWLTYLKDNFANAPSGDMQGNTLEALNLLLLVSNSYEKAERSLSSLVCSPPAWIHLAEIKKEHFRALAHYWTAKGILSVTDTGSAVRRHFRRHFVERADMGRIWDPRQPPQNSSERMELASRHLNFAIQRHEDALHRAELVSELNLVSKILLRTQEATMRLDSGVAFDMNGGTLGEFQDPAEIFGRCEQQAISSSPVVSKKKAEDIFRQLGPLAVFNAEEVLSAPKYVRMKRDSRSPGFGFSICGDAPVCIAEVDPGGLAEKCRLRPGDLIIRVVSTDTKWSKHEEVVNLIRDSGNDLRMVVVSPGGGSQSLSSAYSISTLSTNSGSSPPGSVPIKFRPSYYYKNSGTLPSESKRKEGRNTASPWSFMNLVHAKSQTKSEPRLSKLF